MDYSNHGISNSTGTCICLPAFALALWKEAEAVVGRLDDPMVNGTHYPQFREHFISANRTALKTVLEFRCCRVHIRDGSMWDGSSRRQSSTRRHRFDGKAPRRRWDPLRIQPGLDET